MSLIAIKDGNGGHGPEPYTVDDGQYTEVKFNFEGKQISSWEELRDSILDDEQKKQYNQAPQGTKDEVDNAVKEYYGQLLTDEVNILNRTRFFDTPKECIENVGELITKELCDDILANASDHFPGTLTKVMVDSNTNYCVDRLPMLIHKYRYRQMKMNKISKKDFDVRASKIPAFVFEQASSWYSSNHGKQEVAAKYIQSNDEVVIYRGLTIDPTEAKRIHKGYVEDGNDLPSTLLAKSGMYGSVIYTTMRKSYADRYKDGLFLQGIAKVKDRKILHLPTNDYDGFDSSELREIKNGIPQIKTNIYNKCINSGYNHSQAEKVAKAFEYTLNRDAGACAMLMGYDAITADGHQLDVLNPAMVDLVYEGE